MATENRASAGHPWNQSMVQQFTNEGQIRTRLRKVSPTRETTSVTRTFTITRMR